MLYCVFYEEELIGRFKRQDKAIECFFDWYFNATYLDSNKLKLKTMTKEEYEKYAKKLLDNL